MDQIEKLDDSKSFGFNRKELEREIRTLRLKINEVIDTMNELLESPFMDDEDDDEEDDEDFVVVKVDDVHVKKHKTLLK